MRHTIKAKLYNLITTEFKIFNPNDFFFIKMKSNLLSIGSFSIPAQNYYTMLVALKMNLKFLPKEERNYVMLFLKIKVQYTRLLVSQ